MTTEKLVNVSTTTHALNLLLLEAIARGVVSVDSTTSELRFNGLRYSAADALRERNIDRCAEKWAELARIMGTRLNAEVQRATP